MGELTAIVTMKALDGLTARSMATAQNIANAQTPGYRPVRVSFENALAEASASGVAAVETVKPTFETDPRSPAGEVRLDLELATASSTSARYSALVELLNRQLQIAALAVSGGR